MSLDKVLAFANFGKGSPRRRPTVLIVSPPGFKDQLRDALLAANKEQFSDILQFAFCEHIEDVLAWAPHNQLSPVDYIVIVLDPRDSTCLVMAEDNLSKIDSTFIETGRLCFINGACSIRPAEMGIPLGHINVFSQTYSVMLVNGDVLKPEKCIILAMRIVGLVSVVIGLYTGVPLSVDIPGYLLAEYSEYNQ